MTMKDDTRQETPVEAKDRRPTGEGGHRPYQAPRIAKKRTVSRATLFSGSGPDTGGVVTQ